MTPFNRALVGASVPSGAKVSPGGMQGVIGIQGQMGPRGDKGLPGSQGLPGTIPPGVVWDYAGITIPQGWLECDNAEYSVLTYPDLYAAIGNQFGGSPGSTFRVPPCQDRVSIGRSGTRAVGTTGGAETHTLNVSQIPPHSHNRLGNLGNFVGGGTAAATWNTGTPGAEYGGTATIGGGLAHNNMQPFVVFNKIIKT